MSDLLDEATKVPYLCEQCYPDHKEISEINPLLTVVVDKYGMYYICWGQQGHKGSLYMMQTKPWPDPFELLSEEEQDKDYSPDGFDKQFDLWIHKASIDQKTFFYWLGSIESSYDLIKDITRYGYSQSKDGYVWFYIFHKAGMIIENYEQDRKRD